MLRLIGAQADGWVVSASYVPPEEILPSQDVIDSAARQAGRDPAAIRRVYNLGGVVQALGQTNVRATRRGVLVGPVARWAEEIVRYYQNLRLDTFLFWPAGGDEERQIRRFAEEVVPAVRETLGSY
jgi:alkanesulfonate monooxygenase SsuD/methylene tetrahydromethanopterin reductase-like flavin-dependent oxidoreductase (luciferase family)